MIDIRRSTNRGYFDHGWLKTFHSFSFGDYHNPDRMAFGPLRVINEDFILKGSGFGTHSHRNMEIITCVLSGELAHKDSMGNGSGIKPGEFQYMSAGSGVTHSEFNFSQEPQTHLYQIWIVPNQTETKPRYSQVHIKDEDKFNRFALVAGPHESGAPIEIHQNAKMYVSNINLPQQLTFEPGPAYSKCYIQVMSGKLNIKDHILLAGDACAFTQEKLIQVSTSESAESPNDSTLRDDPV